MSSILEKIITHKKKEVEDAKKVISFKEITKDINKKNDFSLIKKLKEKEINIISEFKRKSPSKGIIHHNPNVNKITKGYVNAGVSAISILTDNFFFGGSNEDLINVRKDINIPILRKDFIIDEYQVFETKKMGANIILLIASALDKDKYLTLLKISKEIGLEVLLEIHNEEELENFYDSLVDIVGVNNRNLNDFETNINISINLSSLIPKGVPKISESGIYDIKIVKELSNIGYNGFLIGDNFMRTNDPELTCLEFINKIK